MNIRLYVFSIAVVSAQTLALGAPQEGSFGFKDAYALLQKHCEVCHDGTAPAERPVSRFDVRQVQEPSSLVAEAELWKRVLTKVREEEMPPPGRPAPTKEQRATFVKWLEDALKPSGTARAIPRFAGERDINDKAAAAATTSKALRGGMQPTSK